MPGAFEQDHQARGKKGNRNPSTPAHSVSCHPLPDPTNKTKVYRKMQPQMWKKIEWLKDNVQQQRQQPKLGIAQMRRHDMFKNKR